MADSKVQFYISSTVKILTGMSDRSTQSFVASERRCSTPNLRCVWDIQASEILRSISFKLINHDKSSFGLKYSLSFSHSLHFLQVV